MSLVDCVLVVLSVVVGVPVVAYLSVKSGTYGFLMAYDLYKRRMRDGDETTEAE